MFICSTGGRWLCRCPRRCSWSSKGRRRWPWTSGRALCSPVWSSFRRERSLSAPARGPYQTKMQPHKERSETLSAKRVYLSPKIGPCGGRTWQCTNVKVRFTAALSFKPVGDWPGFVTRIFIYWHSSTVWCNMRQQYVFHGSDVAPVAQQEAVSGRHFNYYTLITQIIPAGICFWHYWDKNFSSKHIIY